MPHPENAVEPMLGGTDGAALFESLVEARVTSPRAALPVKLPNEPAITPQLVAEHGLKPDEYERILDAHRPRADA